MANCEESYTLNKPDRLKVDREICATVWTSPHAQRLMETLCYDTPRRPAGSKGMKTAVELLGGELRKLGARNVHTEPVKVFTWREADSRVELLSPRRRVYDSFHHVHSAPGEAAGPLVEAGSGTSEELDRPGKRIGGAVLLVHGHQITGGKVEPYIVRLRDMASRGARAVLVRNMYPGQGAGIDLAAISEVLSIPVLGVSCEEGHELASFAARKQARVSVAASGRSYHTRCANLIADMGPARAGTETIILGAHLDYYHLSPGAFDNLSGVVALIEIARALAPFRTKFKRRLRLIAFTGEEFGFTGSKAYVARHANELDSIRFVLNMDSLFDETARGLAVMWAPSMRDYIDRALGETQCAVDVRSMFCMSSDYLPFMLAGIAAARPADFRNAFPPWSHTRNDTPDKIPAEWIRANAMTWAQLLARILTDPRELPARRKSPEEVRALVEKEDAFEALEAFECAVP